MADVNPKVMEMVAEELKKNPDISNPELLEKAKGIDKGIARLSARQFNARYPLQVKRGMKPRKRAGGKKKAATRSRRGRGAARGAGRSAGGNAGGNGGREQIRKIMLELAKDVAGADKGGVVDVIAGIDRYVDRAVKAKR